MDFIIENLAELLILVIAVFNKYFEKIKKDNKNNDDDIVKKIDIILLNTEIIKLKDEK